jgi:trk system potassium uptake protein TrkA
MPKQFVVIGLGSTGTFLTKHLYNLGHNVLAIDINPEKVQDIAPFVSQAVVADCARKKILQDFPLAKADSIIVCIGSLENSLLTVLNLKEMNLNNLIIKASDSSHFAILEKMGIKDIFQPERDMAVELAEKLDRIGKPNMLDYMPLMEGYSIMEWKCPEKLVGKKLMEANLINKYGVQVIAITDAKSKKLNAIPKAQYEFNNGDVLFLFGPNDALDKM